MTGQPSMKRILTAHEVNGVARGVVRGALALNPLDRLLEGGVSAAVAGRPFATVIIATGPRR